MELWLKSALACLTERATFQLFRCHRVVCFLFFVVIWGGGGGGGGCNDIKAEIS